MNIREEVNTQLDILEEVYDITLTSGFRVTLNDLIEALISKVQSETREEMLKDEIKFMKRMKLECDVVICDCGSKLRDWDMAMYVKERLSHLKTIEKRKK